MNGGAGSLQINEVLSLGGRAKPKSAAKEKSGATGERTALTFAVEEGGSRQ
jgi:hypothetical protein